MNAQQGVWYVLTLDSKCRNEGTARSLVRTDFIIYLGLVFNTICVQRSACDKKQSVTLF
jgi:hypothetical protein